ncbi:hypothetical protein [Ancylomarina sp. 16SWW S1-10-2]|uniref:hypothetical protein n=1 Tax=Ancylomarina sp. 16SWW S1-10-2 TaxID=2499681 RepID=UPI0012AD5B13|nr:hypothetical protein [Ancylomarina sp. 16SWW S1-10-2]MRT94129.1 hypothetical protein [Ancylomarina sp. 16SWW S1-10-2]
MRNLFYIVACILISIVVGLLSTYISPELFTSVKSNDNSELVYVEIVEIEPEASIEKPEEPTLENEKDISNQVKTAKKEKEADDNYIEELPPETLFRINRYGKWEFWNYYRDLTRVKFSKKMRNLYEETYNITNKKEPKFKYSIHVFASKNKTLISYLKLKGLYENFDMNENLYRYFYRSFDNYWVCRRELREVRSNGFPDAYIVKL